MDNDNIENPFLTQLTAVMIAYLTRENVRVITERLFIDPSPTKGLTRFDTIISQLNVSQVQLEGISNRAGKKVYFKGTIRQNDKKLEQSCNNFQTLCYSFPLTSVWIILVPYCCLFCVLSNDVLNVSISTFFRRHMHQHQGHKKKNLQPKFETSRMHL